VIARTNRALLLSLFALMFTAPISHGALIYAISTVRDLVSFDSATPGTLLSNVGISGLGAGEQLVGIDFRPSNGLLYGVSVDAGNVGRIYSLNTTTGAATLASTLSTPLPVQPGYGTDFNPVVDRLRIVSTGGLNLRVNVDTGAVTIDTPLTYAAGDPRVGIPPTISGSAYANNVAGALSTTLYDVDIELHQLDTQDPPNNGTLHTIGNLGVAPNSIERAGLDILTTGGTDTAFALLSTQTSDNGFFSVNLGTGAATLVGNIGIIRKDIEDIAAAPVIGPPGGGGTPGTPLPPALFVAIPGAAIAVVRARRWNRGK